MIEFQEFTLSNGLQVIVHEDPSVEIAIMNILYKVGSRDESPDKTGFAHLFEHLMFGGSINIPDFDSELQKLGGENNAFTSTDITNYYTTLPYQNIEAAFWLESDRMLGLPFNSDVLETQRSVVIEEFKQRYLNQPYGDVWLKLRPLAYEEHPYGWPTIGKEISHIEEATMEDVKSFYNKYYNPNNAVMVVAGKITLRQIKELSNKWFSEIKSGEKFKRTIPKEPLQNEKKQLTVCANVPSNMLYMAFHMPGKFDEGYHATDLLSDILGREKSSRLYLELVHHKRMFNSISAYVTGSLDPGLLVISGRMSEGFSLEEGEKAVWQVINKLKNDGLPEEELEKVKNQAESTLAFNEIELLNRAMSLAFSSQSGDTNYVNQEAELVQKVTVLDVMNQSSHLLIENNCCVLYYKSSNEN